MKKVFQALAGLLIIGLIVFRIFLPSLIQKKINATLATLPEYEGRVDGVSLALWRGAFRIQQLTLNHKSGDMALAVEAITTNIRWLPLLHRHVIGTLTITRPTLRMDVQKPAEAKEKTIKKTAEANRAVEAKTGKTIPELLDAALPFKVDAFYLVDGRIRLHVIEAEKKAAEQVKHKEKTSGAVEITVSDLNVTLRNLTNSEALSEDLSAHGEASALVMGRSPVDVRLRVNPLAPQPTFRVSLDVKNLDLAALNPFIDAQFGVTAKNGFFSMFSEASAADGAFKGYVRPLIKDLKMMDLKKDKSLVKIVKEAVVGAVATVLKNSHSERVATEIPFSGRFEDPKANVWQAIGAVLTNAFIRAIAPGYDRNFK